MQKRFLPRSKQLKPRAAELRKHATKEENHLWYDFLRRYPIQFNRQYIIGTYIVDFYCANVGLVIELDGSQHFEENAKRYDDNRTEYLESLGLRVIRFTNHDVHCNFAGVCERIDAVVKASKL